MMVIYPGKPGNPWNIGKIPQYVGKKCVSIERVKSRKYIDVDIDKATNYINPIDI